MSFKLIPISNPGLPRLAWCATVDLNGRLCTVEHGPFVVVEPTAQPTWLVAGAWDGPFEKGGFHKSEHVFGSGVRVEGDELFFVPASTMIDRLFWLRGSSTVHVSNSLVVLLGRLGARLDRLADHWLWSGGAGLGIYDYLRDVRIEHPTHRAMHQVMYESLVVSSRGVRFEFRTQPHHFSDFHDYVEQLTGVVKSVIRNANAPQRNRSARLISNASRGYDSPAVTALLTSLGQTTSYSGARSNTRIPAVLGRLLADDLYDDDGRAIARSLGADAQLLNPDLRCIPAEIERWMWASGQVSPELSQWNVFDDAERGDNLVLWCAGHYGDCMWGTEEDEVLLSGSMARGMPSGYALAEARVRFGIVDCSVPFIFGAEVAGVLAISLSDDMAPWRLGNTYDRPIPRRILEERGIKRTEFGFGKKAVTSDYESPQGKELLSRFSEATHWGPSTVAAYRGINLSMYAVRRARAYGRLHGDRSKLVLHHTPKNSVRYLGDHLDLQRATLLFCHEELVSTLPPAPSCCTRQSELSGVSGSVAQHPSQPAHPTHPMAYASDGDSTGERVGEALDVADGG